MREAGRREGLRERNQMERISKHGSQGDGGDARLHVAMFPFFAFGHISPFAQLAKQLAAHGAKVSFLSAPANVPRVSALLSLASPAVDVVPLHFLPVEGLPQGIQSTAEGTPDMAELLKRAVDLMRPQVESFLADARPNAIVHDFTHQWLPSVAHPLGVKTVFFSVYAALPLAYLCVPSRRPAPHHRPSVGDLASPPAGFPSPPASTVDAIPAYQAANLAYAFESFYGMPSAYDRLVSCMRESSAVVVKTCAEMEAPYLDYLEKEYKKPMLLSGPLASEPPAGLLDERWAGWLDGFPAGSVIYCSFGSESFLTDEEILELALGLEFTGAPFLLVVNFPSSSDGGEEAEEEEDPMEKLRGKLPEGFEERVRGRGMVHSGWLQQQHILAHAAVGCFLCHAGLSSVVEGLVSGCKLVLLPLKVDQFLNARLFAGDLRLAVEVPRREEDGWFTRDDVKDSVKKVMVETAGEPGREVKENSDRWREFLLDGEVQGKYTVELFEKLRVMSP